MEYQVRPGPPPKTERAESRTHQYQSPAADHTLHLATLLLYLQMERSNYPWLRPPRPGLQVSVHHGISVLFASPTERTRIHRRVAVPVLAMLHVVIVAFGPRVLLALGMTVHACLMCRVVGDGLAVRHGVGLYDGHWPGMRRGGRGRGGGGSTGGSRRGSMGGSMGGSGMVLELCRDCLCLARMLPVSSRYSAPCSGGMLRISSGTTAL